MSFQYPDDLPTHGPSNVNVHGHAMHPWIVVNHSHPSTQRPVSDSLVFLGIDSSTQLKI